MSHAEIQGFLFAITCSPELIRPSEWLPLIFDEQEAEYGSMDEAEAVTGYLIEFYNRCVTQLGNPPVSLSGDIELLPDPMDNFGGSATLGQWSRGFLKGHDWLVELWDEYTPESLDDELGSCLMTLSFFTSRELAEAYLRESTRNKSIPLEDFAGTLLKLFPDAMNSYAHLAHSIQQALRERDSPQPASNELPKVGRNDPCPCGSGKKFKYCCLNRLN